MNQNVILTKRINAYAIAAGCFLYLNQEASAQVVYTDIDPDIILNEGDEDADIDMDEDGTFDFFFHNNSFLYYHESWLSFRTMQNILVGPDTNGIGLVGISNYFTTGYGEFTRYYPFALVQNSVINELNEWQTYETQIMALRALSEDGEIVGFGFYCDWYNVATSETIDKYLGVKFKDATNQLHYGWIRCDVLDEGRTLIIKDYAYELEPEYTIVAGDTVHYVGIEQQQNNLSPNIYSFGNNLHINLKEIINCKVSMYDINGGEIFTDYLKETNYSVKLPIPKGVYVVKLESDDIIFSKKIFIQ